MPDALIATEAAFVEKMASQFEAAETAAASAPVVEVPKDPTPAPAPAAVAPIVADPAPVVPDGEPAALPATPTETDSAKPADSDQPKSPEPDEEGSDEGEEEALDAEFVAAAAKHKIPTTLEDLPEEARPLVQKRIKEMEAGLTRAMMEAREYRKAEVTFKAEEKFRTEHPADFIVHMLRSSPELAVKVNTLLDEVDGGDVTRKAHDVVVNDMRAKAAETMRADLAAEDARLTRGMELHSYAVSAAQRAGLPFNLGMEDAVLAAIAQDPRGIVTETQIDQIAARLAKVHQNSIRAVRREASKTYAADKAAQNRTAGLRMKPGTGSAPAPTGVAKPKNDAEFIERFASSM